MGPFFYGINNQKQEYTEEEYMKGIILPTDKYNEFFTRYIKLHQDVLTDIEHCKMELDTLLHTDDGFYAEMISEYLEELLERWDSVYSQILKTEFDQKEKIVSAYLEKMQAADEE